MQSPTIEQIKLIEEVSGFEKGYAFENFIVTLFNRRNFRLLEWRSDKRASNGVFPLSCSFPDLEFDYSRGRKYHRFAIECKWRRQFFNGKITWAYEDQIQKYLDYQAQNAINVIVAIGIGGVPSKPDHLFITPLDHIRMYPDVFRSHLIPYTKDPQQTFDTSEQLRLF